MSPGECADACLKQAQMERRVLGHPTTTTEVLLEAAEIILMMEKWILDSRTPQWLLDKLTQGKYPPRLRESDNG